MHAMVEGAGLGEEEADPAARAQVPVRRMQIRRGGRGIRPG